ncbi:MAG: hypothetical protein CMJ50_02815 [Planctomycetaceae bacterium]|nr:hypothetical protein [Planctomycetaceae bacterium]
MAAENPDIQAIFNEAVARDSNEQRSQYLDEACGDDRQVRRRVEALLRAHSEAGGFFGGQPEATEIQPITERTGTHIGPYKLLQQIGEGGMGVIFMAEQTKPVERRVALKIIKPGMDTRQVIARFEAEEQALAMMDHPNIAKVLDADITETGRPYFVMELVKGVPITEYCDEHHLTPRERLDLFTQVCQAVQHAHQKGIIHRDIKPSNVLVAEYDDEPVPKIIDFGVAKALDKKLTEKTMFTQLGQIVGTLEYMSPEQAKLNQLDIDTRSDIYSLGVLLYELLTGTTPFDRQRLRSAAFDEMMRIIREEEPPKPSTRLSTIDTLASVAVNRGVEPKKLSTQVRGDLDWIVMKALEKDRTRRYETTSSFAEDIRRYLNEEPVQACPPSASYRFRMFARRNKAALTTASVIAFVLVAGIIGTTWQAIRAQRALRVKRETREQVDAAREREDRQRLQINRDLSYALAEVAAQREQMRTSLGNASSSRVREAAQRAIALAKNDLADPELVGRVQQLQGQLEQDAADQRLVGRISESRLVHEGAGNFDWSESLPEYSVLFQDYGVDPQVTRPEQAADRIRSRPADVRSAIIAALDDWIELESKSPETSDETLQWLRLIVDAADDNPPRRRLRLAVRDADEQALADLAESIDVSKQAPYTLYYLGKKLRDSIRREALLRRAQRQFPGDFWINKALASCLKNREQPLHDESIRFITAAAAIQPENPRAQFESGVFLFLVKRKEEAAAVFHRVIEMISSDPSVSFQDTTNSKTRLAAWAYRFLSLIERSKGNMDAALEHANTAIRLNPIARAGHLNRGTILRNKGEFDEAVESYRKAIELAPNYAMAYNNLGNALMVSGELSAALDAFHKSIELNADYPKVYNNLGLALHEQQKLDEAIEAYRKAIQLNPDYSNAYNNLGNALKARGELNAAVDAFHKAIQLNPDYTIAYNNLGNALKARGELNAAVDAFHKAIELNADFPAAYNNLGLVLIAQQKLDEAIDAFHKAIELNADYPKAYNNLGTTLCAQQKLDEAIVAYRKAIELEPNYAMAYYNLGNELADQGSADEAIEAYRKAIQLNPDYPEAYCMLGKSLGRKGQFIEALEAVRRGHELGSKDPRWPYPSAQWVQACESLVELDTKLTEVLQGETSPADASQCIALADLCYSKQLFAAAAGFFRRAFADKPELAHSPNGYNAACTAALASSGQGNDAADLSEEEKVRWREQALEWLKLDLAHWTKQLDNPKNQTRKSRAAVQKTLLHWRRDPDLASVRDKTARDKLPEKERQAWNELWTELEKTITKGVVTSMPRDQKQSPKAEGES